MSDEKSVDVPDHGDAPQQADEENKVPAWAEDIEHTLRRIVAAKELRRAKSPGMYL